MRHSIHEYTDPSFNRWAVMSTSFDMPDRFRLALHARSAAVKIRKSSDDVLEYYRDSVAILRFPAKSRFCWWLDILLFECKIGLIAKQFFQTFREGLPVRRTCPGLFAIV